MPVKPCSTWARHPNLTAARTEVDINNAPDQLRQRIFGETAAGDEMEEEGLKKVTL
jgi:hypothetical protein